MSRRTVGLLSVAVAIAGLNLWHWWPSPSGARSESRPSAMRGPAEGLQVRVAAASQAAPPLGRDLFSPPRAVPKAPPRSKVEAPAPDPPPKTAEELAEEAARAELAQIKLVGIVFRGGEGEAFLVKGERAYVARPGGRIGQRFAVESVTRDTVLLKDPATDVSATMSVSGEEKQSGAAENR